MLARHILLFTLITIFVTSTFGWWGQPKPCTLSKECSSRKECCINRTCQKSKPYTNCLCGEKRCKEGFKCKRGNKIADKSQRMKPTAECVAHRG